MCGSLSDLAFHRHLSKEQCTYLACLSVLEYIPYRKSEDLKDKIGGEFKVVTLGT